MARTKTLQRQLTETDYPQQPEGRLKGSQKGQVEHYWAGNKRNEGRDGNLYYRSGTIFSYGIHFPIARHVKTRKGVKFILFTTRDWSLSTSKHKSHVRSAIPKDATVFYVPSVTADFYGSHLDNLKAIEKEALALVVKAKRARSHKEWHLSKAIGLINSGNAYAAAVGLKERLGSPTGDDLASWAAKVQEEAEITQKRLEAAQKAKYTKERKTWEKELVEWQSGTRVFPPGRLPILGSVADDPRAGLAYVRVSRGKYLQTTLGMTVPLKEVMPVLETIRAGISGYGGIPFGTPQGPVTRFFEIQDWEGTIHWDDKLFVIGCHRIQFSEIERAAKAAGL